MSIDIQKLNTADVISIPFGMRLKSAREARGLESKDVAIQLCLSEKMIILIEKETYPIDLPVIFVRGYIRAYARLMEIPDAEINKALEPIEPLPILENDSQEPFEAEPVTSSNYFMQLFTYLIFFTIIGLVGVWWYSHTTTDNHQSTEIPILHQYHNNQPSVPNPVLKSATNNLSSASMTPSSNALSIPNTIPIPKAIPIIPKATVTTNNNMASPQSESMLTIRMISNNYPTQFFTHLILFLLIGLVMLWWQPYSLSPLTSSGHPLTVIPTPFDSSFDLKMTHIENLSSFAIHSTPRNRREIKITLCILTSLVSLSLISLTSLWWYNSYPIFTWEISHTEKALFAENGTRLPLLQELAKSPVLPKTKSNPELKTKDVQSIEKPTQMSKNANVQPRVKNNQTASISSGQYSPVPVTKKISTKHGRRQVIPQVDSVEDDFSELDDDTL